MNTKKLILCGLTVLTILFYCSTAKATEGEEIKEKAEDYRCKNLEVLNIPVGNFKPPRIHPHEAPYETQQYNPPNNHSGMDYGGELEFDDYGNKIAGRYRIFSMLEGKVIISQKNLHPKSWGESIVIATRLNEFSEEIVTHHYHHLHAGNNGGKNHNEYFTTRKYSACDTVPRGALIGMEGSTGKSSGPHLHFGMRRWSNITQLNQAIDAGFTSVFGPSYPESKNELHQNLNPKTFLNNTFLDYDFVKPQEEWKWYWRTFWYAEAMRSKGIELGKWDGEFGADDNVTRREAAKWIKIAAMRPSHYPSESHPVQHFSDVAIDDPDYPYIEALAAYPAIKPTIDKGNNGQMKAFEPDRELCRSEALKMIITAFHLPEYLEYYRNNFWMRRAEDVLTTILPYKDLHPLSWYASYAMFALDRRIINFGEDLNACNQVNRAQFAYMLVRSARDLDNYLRQQNESTNCGPNQFSHPTEDRCIDIPTCIPTENQPCAIGGGLVEEEGNYNRDTTGNQYSNSLPQTTQTQACTSQQIQQIQCNKNGQLGIQRRGCVNNQTWGEWSSCMIPDDPAETEQEGTCLNCGCTPGYTRTYKCWLNGREGQKVQTCTPGGYWGEFSSCQTGGEPNPSSNPPNQPYNQNSQQNSNPTQPYNQQNQQTNPNNNQPSNQQNPPNQTEHPDSPQTPDHCECTTGPCCDGCKFSSTRYACKSWYTYRCPDNRNGSDAQKALVRQYCPGNANQCTGETKQFSWEKHQDCSLYQKCTMQGGESTCVGSCRDTYSANRTEACYTNKYSAGSPTLCLGIRQQDDFFDQSKAKWQYRVCKQGGAFQNNFKMLLRDDNHNIILNQRTNSKGMTCSPWINFDTNYIDKYGSTNGAGLTAEVLSPSNCTTSSCKYTTGSVTISLACR